MTESISNDLYSNFGLRGLEGIKRDYIQINIVSPRKVLKWTERVSPMGVFIGEIKEPM